MDGWWAEAYTPEVGWAIGDGNEHGDDPQWDAVEAEQLYSVLENEVIPEFYDRNRLGIPLRWLTRMRASMSQLTPQFSAVRTVREYTEQHYLPAATAFAERAAYNGAAGTAVVNWEHSLREKWGSLQFGEFVVESTGDEHHFAVNVDVDGLDLSFVRVELYADSVNGEPAVRQEMLQSETSENAEAKGTTFHITVAATRPASDFTPRIVPSHASVAVPLELDLIRWQR
ncbi:alpha glucan phosphorylase [Rhodopirellula maiorica SM1]|uniref:Alpha glucan phosphorylase n=1 Tax=Rhodopirellula maiorica SM1 TaxID=1265738 RepID=M5RPJ2_9BACT|nr:alpha glucan phosphorylase [Rhodopirellula maiorica SM1]